ncbi:ferritin-like domain-containing protein [Amphiplicatus metriothermophilus]|uniref:ferritin-like domain-containing protein n=1 Tax=Amphiplicatus metriothermophilus TaxID=1519374 RepID=UPI000B77DA37
MAPATSLACAAQALATAEPRAKAAAALDAAVRLQAAPALDPARLAGLADRPARPARPILAPPGKVPRRRLGSPRGRIALLHALAHIEFNAIDLAFDMAARFACDIAEAGLDARAFVADWAQVGADEARHFLMLADRLEALGAAYGDLPAHDRLWEAALATRDDALARLAVAPMALEARGLDVTPGLIARLEAAGDARSAALLRVIYEDEIGHVAAGVRWFRRLCARRGLRPAAAFRKLIAERLAGGLKPPFNTEGRSAADLTADFYAETGRIMA